MSRQTRDPNLRKFDRNIKEWNKKIQAHPSKVIRFVASQVIKGVINKTPVDTGAARGGWDVGVGSPPPQVGKGKQRNAEAAITTNLIKLGTLNQLSPVVFLANYTPHIFVLEQGSSTQAPNGMVAVTIAEVTTKMRFLLRQLKR